MKTFEWVISDLHPLSSHMLWYSPARNCSPSVIQKSRLESNVIYVYTFSASEVVSDHAPGSLGCKIHCEGCSMQFQYEHWIIELYIYKLAPGVNATENQHSSQQLNWSCCFFFFCNFSSLVCQSVWLSNWSWVRMLQLIPWYKQWAATPSVPKHDIMEGLK